MCLFLDLGVIKLSRLLESRVISFKVISKYRIALAGIVLAASSYFVYSFFSQNIISHSGGMSFPAGEVIVSVVFLTLIGHFLNGWSWWYSLKGMSVHVGFLEAYRAWALSRIARYLPGKVALYFVRFSLHRVEHKSDVLWASILEMMASLFVLLLLCLAFLASYLSVGYFCGAISITLILASAGWKVFKGPIDRYVKGSFGSGRKWGWYLVCRVLVVHVVLCLCHGVAFFLVLNDISSLGWENFLYVIVAYNLAALWGQLSLVAPAGLGVKEAGLIVMLGEIIASSSEVLSGVICIRLILVLSDVLNAALSSLSFVFVKKQL